MKVRKTLTEFLEKVPSIEKVSPLQWETLGTRLYLLPSYTPERYLIQLNERVHKEGLQLLLLVPKIITAKDYANINRYGNYRLKARAIYSYAYLYSIPRRFILTNGQIFYHLTNRRQVWSIKYEQYCKTLFDYEMREVGLDTLLA